MCGSGQSKVTAPEQRKYPDGNPSLTPPPDNNDSPIIIEQKLKENTNNVDHNLNKLNPSINPTI